MTPEELKRQLDAGDDLFVLEVREPHEHQICNLVRTTPTLGPLRSTT